MAGELQVCVCRGRKRGQRAGGAQQGLQGEGETLLTLAETASTRKGKRRRAAFTLGAFPGAPSTGFLPVASLVRRSSRLDLPDQCLFFLLFFFFFR